MQQLDRGPSAFAWLVAFISLVLPWAAAILALFGLWYVAHNELVGWWYVAAGGVLFITDGLIDFVWAHPSVLRTDQPDLNRRPDQLVGRLVVVEEDIVHGRGKVRVDDTVWLAEGPDALAGVEVRVMAAQGTVLSVKRIDTTSRY